jgi:hypothetical protein
LASTNGFWAGDVLGLGVGAADAGVAPARREAPSANAAMAAETDVRIDALPASGRDRERRVWVIFALRQ